MCKSACSAPLNWEEMGQRNGAWKRLKTGWWFLTINALKQQLKASVVHIAYRSLDSFSQDKAKNCKTTEPVNREIQMRYQQQ